MKKITLFIFLSCLFGNKIQSQCFEKISSGGWQGMAIATDGSLWAWGHNEDGFLGTGTIGDVLTPQQVAPGTTWRFISTNDDSAFAIKPNGTLWAWGYNYLGRLGDGTDTDRLLPVQIGTDSDWSIAASGAYQSAAIKSNGTLWTWGFNGHFALGIGPVGGIYYNPIQVGTDTNWQQVVCGDTAMIGLKTDGTIWSWGRNNYGVLGAGDEPFRYIPTQIGTDNDWRYISLGAGTAAAIKSNATLWMWGSNQNSLLGNGNNDDSNIPIQVGSDTDWQSVTAEFQHTIAIKTNGTMWGWGTNVVGELGNGLTGWQTTPTQSLGSDWVASAAGSVHTVALKSNGDLYTFGYALNGRLGVVISDSFTSIPVNIECPFLSNHDFDKEKIIIYPNPANSVINFKLPEGQTVNNLHVSDIGGKIVLNQDYFESQLDISKLSNGLYFISLRSETGSMTFKFIKN